MTIATRLVTAEELLEMSDSNYLELYEGELKKVSPANARHGDVALQIGMLLRQYVSPRKLGKVMVEVGFVLRRNPDTVLGPDVSFLKQSRIPEGGLPEKFIEGFPDLAVEVISPRNPRKELTEKMKTYVAHGAALGWLVDPNAKSVDVYRPRTAVEKLKKGDVISGEPVIAGFSTLVSEFFV